jgi:uncharacterized membrane protein
MVLDFVFTFGPLLFIALGIILFTQAKMNSWSRRLDIVLAVIFFTFGVVAGIWRLSQPAFGPFT